MTPLLRDLVFEVLPHFGLEHLGEDAITIQNRHKSHANARAVCMWVARKRTALSFPELGRCFGRDHSTVMAACAKVEKALDADPHGLVATAARAAFVAFQPDCFESQKQGGSGAREVSFEGPTAATLEVDSECSAIGVAAE